MLLPILSAERKWLIPDGDAAHNQLLVCQRTTFVVRVLRFLSAIVIPRSPSRYCQNS